MPHHDENAAEGWPILHMLQSEYAAYRGVSRKTVTGWKQRGLLVFSGGDLIDVVKSDAALAERPQAYRGGAASQAPEADD